MEWYWRYCDWWLRPKGERNVIDRIPDTYEDLMRIDAQKGARIEQQAKEIEFLEEQLAAADAEIEWLESQEWSQP